MGFTLIYLDALYETVSLCPLYVSYQGIRMQSTSVIVESVGIFPGSVCIILENRSIER
jgi:hypothetical protein